MIPAKMRNIIYLYIWILLTGCKNEEEKFHPLQFDVYGIDLVYNEVSGSLDGTIPAEGDEFTLKGKGELYNNIYVASVYVNGVPQKGNGSERGFTRPKLGSPLTLVGEWGEIEYLSDSESYVINFKIKANDVSSQKH